MTSGEDFALASTRKTAARCRLCARFVLGNALVSERLEADGRAEASEALHAVDATRPEH